MFDFFKLTAPAKYSQQLLKAETLDFNFNINNDSVIQTTEHGYKRYWAKLKGFDIVVWQHSNKPHRIEIKGSFHKLFEGGSNYKDFNFNDFKTAVYILCSYIKIPSNELTLHLFEIGVNIIPPIKITKLIEGIKTLSGKKFERDTFQGTGLEVDFDFAQYRVKIYNKGSQYNRPEPLLRFELKVKKMAYIQNKGVNITTLQDLIIGDLNYYLGNLLLTQWDKIIICPEGIINPNLITNPRTRKNFINGLNPDYWTGLTNKAYNRQFHRFIATFKEFADVDIYSIIRSLISEKWEHLSKEQRGQYYPYVYGNNIPFDKHQPEPRFCKSCGRDISNQRKGSMFCSETFYGPSVKQCRNLDSNSRNNRKRKENRIYPGLTLFPVYLHYGFI